MAVFPPQPISPLASLNGPAAALLAQIAVRINASGFAQRDRELEALLIPFAISIGRFPDKNKTLNLLKRHFATLPTPPAPPNPAPPELLVPPAPPPKPCTICGDDVDGNSAIRLKCGHTFDATCIQQMFTKASFDESLFPPKCCRGTVELREVESHLPNALVEKFKKKSLEFTTADRVYCHDPTCASFLGPASAEPTTLRCAECNSGTCACCKAQTHPGVPCHFAAEDAVLDLGKAQGWQRCPACRHLVELSAGCHHITCRCGKEFCYVCATTWRECNCPLFHVPPEDG